MNTCPRCDLKHSDPNNYECECGYKIRNGNSIYKTEELFLDKYKYSISFLKRTKQTHQTQINWNVKKQKEEFDFDLSYDATVKKYGCPFIWRDNPVIVAKIKADASITINSIIDYEEKQELILSGLRYKITIADIQKYLMLM